MRRLHIAVLCLVPLAAIFGQAAQAADRPNIVWISCEDISSHLGCYGDPNATTPHLDAFAKQGVRYTQAFTCHGVCAPCRTGIITGMYPPGLGANHMRSKASLPPQIKLFPSYLKDAGYYCTNNSKTDYNLRWERNKDSVWDESSKNAHWKNRQDPQQPFFAVFNMTMTHESRIWPENWKGVVKNVPPDELHDPSNIKVPPLYPDTPDVRAAHARLLDIIMVMDETAGKYLKEIEDAGLAEDTIVIYWSDHGNGFPRAKRWLYDSGTLVPMIAQVPEKWRVDGQAAPGSVSDQLINLIDLGPTVLNLAGIKVPDNMYGQPFLGKDLPKARDYIHGARDRIDERFDMVRSVRDGRFRYLRNFNTWRPSLQHIQYAETSVVRKEMRRLNASGELHAESAQFLNPTRPFEELYDIKTDPWELKNLAADPAYADTLSRLSKECDRWQLDMRDAHLIPEIILDEEEQTAGSRWAILHNGDAGLERTKRLLELAKRANSVDLNDTSAVQAAAGQFILATDDDDPAIRWWGVTGLTNIATASEEAKAKIASAAADKSPSVSIAGARGLHKISSTALAVTTLREHLKSASEFVRHAALIELDEIGAAAAEAKAEVESLRKASKNANIRNVADHLLQSL